MYNYLIKIEYDGTPFVGWQFQKNGTSVQKVLQDAIFLFSQDIRIDSFQGFAVPSPTIPDACPTVNYDFGTVFTNTSLTETLTTSTATLKITVVGTNPATYYVDIPDSDVETNT